MVRDKKPSQDMNTTADAPEPGSGASDRAASVDTPPCLIVGIGASAGGQAALEQLFTSMPANCGLAFVVIMHLHPDGPSYLHEILGRCTPMPVLTAEDGMDLQPDTIHVIPPGMDLTVAEGRIRLGSAERTSGPRHPIDRFFESLAADAAARGIAVVLSGFGIDGSAGIKAVKDAGGAVLVQEPASAINPAMPRSAIATGAADFVLPAEEIAAKIAEIARGSCVLPHLSCRIATLDDELAAIFRVVKIKTGHDFSSYKANTVMRRIERRMAMNEVSGIGKYVALIEENPREAHALCQDILIGVTSFFRDPEAFDILRQQVIPRLFEGRDPEEPVRIWHACCATGEEVYSMAILIQEHLQGNGVNAKVQLFATDIDETAISQARAGIYSDDIEQDLGRERLERFFTRTDGRWQVKKQLREMVVFAHHSLIKDPPFSRLDLLVCRNFLIYLNPDMQKRLITLFHQVLKSGAVLFLGSAETVGRNSELFTTIDNKWKIFERQESKRRMKTVFPLATSVRIPTLQRPARPTEATEPSPGIVAERLLMERYSPPCVVVNDKFEMVHVSTRLGHFLEVPTGEPTRDILRMAREDLRPTLRAAIYKTFAEQKRIEFRGVKVADEGRETTINLIVEPLGPTPGSNLAMVVFEPGVTPAHSADLVRSAGIPDGEAPKDTLIHQLEEQLRVTHEQLQATSEQLETSNEGFMSANEELMSINEEFQSANEELQSTNEELETSKEELQALNEELITVNAELQGKVEELNQATSDMENLLASSKIATLFLDRELHIRGFTPAAAAIFNLISTDIGRSFQHLAGKIDWPTLIHDAETVLAGQPFAEREVSSLDREHCYLKRIFPYLTQEGKIAGIVITFIDITKRKRAEEALAESEQRIRRKLNNIISPEGDIGELDLADIIDASSLQMLVDDFYELTGMPMGLIDLKGDVLVGVGWQDVCTKFHRVNSEACKNCIESDVQLSAGVPHGEYKIYKCKNNMWDVATPVMVGDRHFGNLFMGQFFFEDEPIDYELFRSQAKEYGFDEKEYITALEAVPRLNRETLNTSMHFFMKLADILSKLSYSNLKLARSLSERDALMESLRESEERFRNMFERHKAVMLLVEPESGAIVDANAAAAGFYGSSREELRGLKIQALHQLPSEEMAALLRAVLLEQRNHFKARHRLANGEIRWVEVYSTPVETQGKTLLFSIIHDVTDREWAEEELRRAHDKLEKRVGERTNELAETVETLLGEMAVREKAEASLMRLNRLYAVLGETAQAIIRADNRDALFHDFCRIAVDHGGFILSWVGLLDEASGELGIGAAYGATGYLDDILITTKKEPAGIGPTGISIREGSYYICNNFQNDPCTQPWHERGRAYGIQASASVAVKEEGWVIGALTLYAGEKDFFDRQQVDLLVQMGADVSFALDNLALKARRQRMEKALQEETLERLTAVEALREKEQMLIQQSRQAAMGEMINNIAHQWRQPLNTLGLMVQQLSLYYDLDKIDREFLDQNVGKSMELIQYMSKTIDDFRNYFKPDKEKNEFLVYEAIVSTLTLLEGSLKNPKISIEIDAKCKPVINGYQNEFAQVLLNIVINARDALIERRINDPKVKVTIYCEGNGVIVTVADNAGGIPEEIIGKIFDPYFTTKGPQQGTGVGLFMSKTIIEKNMGGRLAVRNSEYGAEFRIEVGNESTN